MLVLTRRDGETLLIGDNIRITVVKSSSGQAKIGIDAPDDIIILREELQNGSIKDRDRRGNM